MMQFLIDHRMAIAIVLAVLYVAGRLGWWLWTSGAFAGWRWPGGGKTAPAVAIKSDLDAALGLLSRAKERAKNHSALLPVATADALGHVVELLVKELTA